MSVVIPITYATSSASCGDSETVRATNGSARTHTSRLRGRWLVKVRDFLGSPRCVQFREIGRDDFALLLYAAELKRSAVDLTVLGSVPARLAYWLLAAPTHASRPIYSDCPDPYTLPCRRASRTASRCNLLILAASVNQPAACSSRIADHGLTTE